MLILNVFISIQFNAAMLSKQPLFSVHLPMHLRESVSDAKPPLSAMLCPQSMVRMYKKASSLGPAFLPPFQPKATSCTFAIA